MKLRLKQSAKWLGYITVTILIVFLTIALVIYGQGYGFNPETGKLVGGGLFYINSQPSGAQIFIDDEHYGSTESRVRMPVAEYQVDLHKDGYRNWSNKLSIRERKVTHLQYPRLIPDTVPTVPVDSVGKVKKFTQSSNQQYLAVVETGVVERVRVFAADNMDEPRNVFTLPNSRDFTITGLNWSSDDSRVLLTASSSGGNAVRFVLSTEADGEHENVTDVVNGTLKTPVVMDSARIVYGIQDGVLRRFDLSTGAVSDVATNVRGYGMQEGTIYAIQKQSDDLALVRITTDGNISKIADYPEGRDYKIEAFNYDGETRVALHDKTNDQASLIDGLESERPNTESFRPGSAGSLTVSPGGRFVIAQSGKHFTTKDIRTDNYHRFTLDNLDSAPVWYSNHHLLAVRDGEVIFFDFDGANRQLLTHTDTRHVLGNREHDEVYSFRRNTFTDQMQLQRTVLE